MTKYTKERLNSKLNNWKKAVDNGTSKLFFEWNAYTGCSKEDFIKELEWLFNDPQDGKTKNRNPFRRETYCYPDGTFHRFVRMYGPDDSVCRVAVEDYNPEGTSKLSSPVYCIGLNIFDPIEKLTIKEKENILDNAKKWRKNAKTWGVI